MRRSHRVHLFYSAVLIVILHSQLQTRRYLLLSLYHPLFFSVHVPYREVIVAKEHRFELEKAASETTDGQSNNKRGKKGRQKTKCEIPVQRPLERNHYKGGHNKRKVLRNWERGGSIKRRVAIRDERSSF
jgi:hypothetical protein